jgi:hypothetical protein
MRVLMRVMAGLVPATPIIWARPCSDIGVAGTSPAMTRMYWWGHRYTCWPPLMWISAPFT